MFTEMRLFLVKLYACPAFLKYTLTRLWVFLGPQLCGWDCGVICSKMEPFRAQIENLNFLVNLLIRNFWNSCAFKENLCFVQIWINKRFFCISSAIALFFLIIVVLKFRVHSNFVLVFKLKLLVIIAFRRNATLVPALFL